MTGLAVAVVAVSLPARGEARRAAHVRVDQLGYAPAETKVAYLLAPKPVRGARFKVLDVAGDVVLRGRPGANRGRWNRRYAAVHPLNLSELRTPGVYRVRVRRAVSPAFRVAPAAELLLPRVADTVTFFQAQRDGIGVLPGALGRLPSHLDDRQAQVYAHPRYDGPDSDVIKGGSLSRIAGPVDLEGGWADAGDFVKFTHATAYAATLLFVARRSLGAAAPPALEPEARHGLAWLDKAWLEQDRSLLMQVGIGSGNVRGTFNGDHDLWRLPSADDTIAGKRNRYLRNRPAFRANAPGKPVPPNLAGRVAAAFALSAQLDATVDPARARAELETAASIFAAAKIAGVRESDVATALPHAFYPESSWRDDMELGAAELALAGQALGDARAGDWLRASAHWARAYLSREAGGDTLNLYDTSAVAHADLVQAMRMVRGEGLEVGEAALLRDLRAQLRRGAGARARTRSARASSSTTSTRRRTRSASPRRLRCIAG